MKPTYEELEARCAALTAENAGLKAAVIERKNLSEEIRKAGKPPHADFWHQSIYMADKKVDDALNCTASTDAFLAEVRAQGVEMCSAEIQKQTWDEREGDGMVAAIDAMEIYAAQLRKGAQS